ncbi:hypothetical protein Tco_1569875 [Tanacetum coccineum]
MHFYPVATRLCADCGGRITTTAGETTPKNAPKKNLRFLAYRIGLVRPPKPPSWCRSDDVTATTAAPLIKKIEDEFYGLTINGSDLKTYIRRFQELAILCLNMVPNSEKLMEAFIGGLPQSIKGNITASKPQTLEEAINISQRKDIMRISAQKQITGPQESILRDELATLETTLEDIQLSSESSSI